jgi:hypothetical protein
MPLVCALFALVSSAGLGACALETGDEIAGATLAEADPGELDYSSTA